jgi:hypothetical protein
MRAKLAAMTGTAAALADNKALRAIRLGGQHDDFIAFAPSR